MLGFHRWYPGGERCSASTGVCSVCDVRVPSLISWRRTLFSLCRCVFCVCDVRVPSLISWRRTLFSLCWCHWVLFISLPKPSAASSKLTTSSVSQLLYIMSCLIVMVGLELFAFSRYCLIWPQSHCPVLFVCCGCMNDNTDWAISLSIPLLPSLPRGLNDTIKMSVLGSAGFEIPCSYSMGNYPGCLQLVEIYWNLKPSWKSWIYMILLEIFVYIVRFRWLTALVSNHDNIGYRYRIAYRRNWSRFIFAMAPCCAYHVFVLYLVKTNRFGTLHSRPKHCKHHFSWNPSWNLLEICSVKFVDTLLS